MAAHAGPRCLRRRWLLRGSRLRLLCLRLLRLRRARLRCCLSPGRRRRLFRLRLLPPVQGVCQRGDDALHRLFLHILLQEHLPDLPQCRLPLLWRLLIGCEQYLAEVAFLKCRCQGTILTHRSDGDKNPHRGDEVLAARQD